MNINSINVTKTNEETQKAIERESSITVTDHEDKPSTGSYSNEAISSSKASSHHCLTVNCQKQRPNPVEVPDGCSAKLKSILEKKNSEQEMNRPIYPNLPYPPYGSPSLT